MQDKIAKILQKKFFIYKGKHYEALKYVLLKCPFSGDWRMAIEYTSITPIILKDGQVFKGSFIREASDFITKFEPVIRD